MWVSRRYKMTYKMLLIYVVLCITNTRGQLPCTNSSQGVCCLCLEGCNSTCPEGWFKVNYPSTVCTQTLSTSTSDPDVGSSSGTTTVTIFESGSTTSTTGSGDNEDKFACVPECPNGYYVNTTGWCIKCGQLCATAVTTTVMVIDNATRSSVDMPVGAIVGGAVGGVAFLVMVAVIVCCCCLVRKRQIPEAIEIRIQTPPPSPNTLSIKNTKEDEGDYENLPNDEKYRYTKDPCQSVTERLARRTEQQPDDPGLAELPLAPTTASAPHQSIIDEIRESDDNQGATGEQDSIYINIPKSQPDYQNLALDDDEYVNDDVMVDLRRQMSKLTNNDEDIYQNQDVK